MLAFLTSLALGVLFSAPAPERPLLTLESARGGPAHWYRLATVYEDGRWTAGPSSGRLAPEVLSNLRDFAMGIPADASGPRPKCRARPIAFLAVTTPNGRYLEGTPCGQQFAPPVADLAAILGNLGQPEPLVRLEEASVHGGSWQVRAAIYPDGRWQGRGGQGQLGAAELASLKKALTEATFQHERRDVMCDAIATTRYRLVASAASRGPDALRELTWESPCSASPDASTVALQRLVGDLTGAE